MMKRLSFLATLAVATGFAADAHAQAAAVGFAGYSQSSGTSSISYTRMGAPFPVRLSATAPVAFTVNDPSFLRNPAGPDFYQNARLTLTAQSSSMVQGSGVNTSQDGFFGTFIIRDATNTVNLLTGAFNNAVLNQNRNNTLAFETNMVEFTSDIFVPGLLDEDFIISMAGSFGILGTSGGAYNNFTANRTSAGFTALSPAMLIPEPASLAMAGLGVLALPLALRVARRRKALASN